MAIRGAADLGYMTRGRWLKWAYLHVWTRAKLEQRLCALVGGERLRVEMSGRVALRRLAEATRAAAPLIDRPTALVPEFICNVVPMALLAAGYEVVTYASAPSTEPTSESLMAEVERTGATLLVVAPLFGSSGGVDAVLAERFVTFQNARRLHVVIDSAQDAALALRVQASAVDLTAILLSFNDKSFLGALGGASISTWPLARSSALGWRRLLRLYRFFFAKLQVGPPSEKGTFDFSRADRFPFTLEAYRPAKLQLIMAIIGFEALPEILAIKAERLRELSGLRAGPYLQSTAYVTLMDQSGGSRPERRLKAPYGVGGNGDVSLHPNLRIVHNKGFQDYYPNDGSGNVMTVTVRRGALFRAKQVYALLRRAFVHKSYDSNAYWRSRAAQPGQAAVMYTNEGFNRLFRERQFAVLQRFVAPEARGTSETLRVLDIGCGIGVVAKQLVGLAPNVEVVGVDFREMISIAQSQNPDARIRYESSPAEEYFVSNRPYDVVVSAACLSMIRSIPALERALGNCCRMLRPGGTLLLIDPFHRWKFLARARYGSADVRRFVAAFGLEPVASDGILFWPFREWLANSSVAGDDLRRRFELGERLLAVLGRHFWSDYKVLVFRRGAVLGE
jgi:2-polyprenyl-3-methyl-5-hydroxy-6-metoxy-1,4-benzoquinol methylase